MHEAKNIYFLLISKKNRDVPRQGVAQGKEWSKAGYLTLQFQIFVTTEIPRKHLIFYISSGKMIVNNSVTSWLFHRVSPGMSRKINRYLDTIETNKTTRRRGCF